MINAAEESIEENAKENEAGEAFVGGMSAMLQLRKEKATGRAEGEEVREHITHHFGSERVEEGREGEGKRCRGE